MAHDRVPHEDVLLAEDAHELRRHLLLELLPPAAVDEITRLVVAALHTGDREDLRQDDLAHHRGEISIEHEDARDVLRQQLELDSHVEQDGETIRTRELHELVHAECDVVRRRRLGLRQRCLLALLDFARHLRVLAGPFPGCTRRGRGLLLREVERACLALREDAAVAVGPHIVVAPLDLAGQRVLLEFLQRAVHIHELSLREHHGAALADDRDLVHSDLDDVDLIGACVDVVEAGLQHLLHHALLSRPRKRTLLRRLPGLARHNADVANRNADRIKGLHVIALGIETVGARSEDVLPHALRDLVRRENLAGRQFLSGLRRHDGDLPDLDGLRLDDPPFIVDRIEEMTPLRKRDTLNALLTLLGENRTRRQGLARLRRHDGHMSLGDVDTAIIPEGNPQGQTRRADREREELKTANHFAPPFFDTTTGFGADTGFVTTCLTGRPNTPSGTAPTRTLRTCGAVFA